jgi:outer membrane protein assembly factor BamC
MASLAASDSRQASGASLDSVSLDKAAPAGGTAPKGGSSAAATTAAQNATLAAQTAAKNDTVPEASSAELTLPEAYDRAWLRVGIALDRSNFTVDDRDRARGIYFVRYVDPKDLSSAEQGFWSQVFHGKKEKVAKQYQVNVRAITEDQTRVSIVDDKGQVDSSPQARQIMALLSDQIG